MDLSIGKHLGILLAHFEHDSICDPDDTETLQKISLISRAYSGFSNPEFGDFRRDFQKGYQLGTKDVMRETELKAAESGFRGAPKIEKGEGPSLD